MQPLPFHCSVSFRPSGGFIGCGLLRHFTLECYSPAPDRPRTLDALLKTGGASAPLNKRTPDSYQRGRACKCARRARSEPDTPTNEWRRSSKPRTRPLPAWRPRGREAFLRRDSRPQDHPARQFPRIPVRPTSLLFPAVHGRSCDAFFRLLRRVDVQKSLPIRLGFETREFTPNMAWRRKRIPPAPQLRYIQYRYSSKRRP